MTTSDGDNIKDIKLMFDASREYCTGFYNCEDLAGAD
jgi:hypothetical protein